MPEMLTHAVTVHQPLAWAIAAGHCPIINSTTRPGLEHVGKLVGIHAASGRVTDLYRRIRLGEFPGVELPGDLPASALIGVARLVGVVRKGLLDFQRMEGKSISGSMPADLCNRIRPWWRGPWGWLFEEAVLLPEPIPMRGAGGVWRIPEIPVQTFEPVGVNVLTFTRYAAPWALEQWRKARGM